MSSEFSTDLWTQLSPMAQVIGGFATGVAASFGAGALWYARSQIHTNREVSREQDARQTYSDYLKFCIQYPQFSSSALAVKALPSKTFAKLSDQLTVESEQYCWFISFVLSACEKIHLFYPDDEGWTETIEAQLSYHSPALKEIWSGLSGHYAASFVVLVEGVLSPAAEQND